jgi:CRP-like cAMP-binding protein
MTALAEYTAQDSNYLLARVDPAELELLRDQWERVTLHIGHYLIRPNEPITHAYFPESLIASVIALPDSERVEAVSIGREGFVGYQGVLLHGQTVSETVVQIEGDAYEISATALERILESAPSLRRELEKYVLTVCEETAINAACHRSHNLDARAARWLLHMHDRSSAGIFRITHKYLSVMLGVRRAGVTVALGKLQQLRLLSYSRGKMEILDRAGLERIACKCYRIVDGLQRLGLPAA